MNEAILQEIGEFCRQRGLAESTFGRRAVNDGKLASRLRNGGRITTDTLERIRSFMARDAGATPSRRRILFDPATQTAMPPMKPLPQTVMTSEDPQRNFRFFDNRQKYLLFVNTCSEKWEIASRVDLDRRRRREEDPRRDRYRCLRAGDPVHRRHAAPRLDAVRERTPADDRP